MRAVISQVPDHLLEDRRRSGADRWDEMWEGVLHMTPMPGPEHQDLASGIEGWLRQHWVKTLQSRVYREVNVASIGGWPRDYRIPDLVLLDQPRLKYVKKSHIEGPPLVVIEIYSPGDETYEKLPFYGELGVAEAWVIHRDTRKPEIYMLGGDECEDVVPDSDGWFVSPATGIRMKAKRPRKLLLQRGDAAATRAALPE